MIRNYQWRREIKYSLNYLISLIFICIEIQLQEHTEVIQILSIIIVFVAIIYRVLFSLQQISQKLDLSPIFFWLLTLARISNAKNSSEDQDYRLFIYYVLGFLNGQYNNSFSLSQENQTIASGKAGVQIIIFITCLTMNTSANLYIILITIILSVLIGINEIICKQHNITKMEKSNQDSKQQKLLNELSFQQIKKGNSNDEQMFVKHSRNCALDSVEGNEIHESPQKQVNQNNSNTTKASLWSNLVQQCDDYIIKFSFNSNSKDSPFQNSINNYSFNKFLQDNQLTLIEFLKDTKVFNDLYWTQYDLESNELQKQQTLFDWLHFHLDQYKLIEQLQSKKSLKSVENLDNLQISYLSNQRSQLMDLIMEKSIMGLSSIPYQQSSSEAINLKGGKLTLYGKIRTIKTVFDLNIRFYVFDEYVKENSNQESDLQNPNQNSNQIAVIFIIKDIEKQVLLLKQNIKNAEILESATIFIQNQAQKITELHKKIRESKGQTNLMDTELTSKFGTSIPKRACSLSSNKDSVEEGQSDASDKLMRRSTQIQLFLQRLQFDFFLIEQDNFNFFEVFSSSEKIWFDKKKIDISQTINYLFEQFMNHSTVVKFGIKFLLQDNNLHDKIIVTDARRFKQLLINILNNSIQAYNYEQYLQQPNEIEVVIWNYYEEIFFTIIDFGCGVTQIELNPSRLQENKLGLAASQRLIYQLSGGKKQITIQCLDQKTTVSFQLQRILFQDKIQYSNNVDFEYINLINS